MKIRGIETTGGRYYGRRLDGALELLPGDLPIKPDATICRRTADFAPAPIPAGAAFTSCARCGEEIAFNPAGPHQDAPKICLQCGNVEPLPIPLG
jgi:hypothetical protein